jgi:hypothetical protein
MIGILNPFNNLEHLDSLATPARGTAAAVSLLHAQ